MKPHCYFTMSYLKLQQALLTEVKGISITSKVLFTIIADKINYSKFNKDGERYFYMPPEMRNDLAEMLDCKVRTLRVYVTELMSANLICTHQTGKGIQIYEGELSKKLGLIAPKKKQRVTESCQSEWQNYDTPLKQTNKTNVYSSNSSIVYDYKYSKGQGQPTKDDVRLYFESNRFISDYRDFFEYYNSKDWKIQGEPIKNWRLLADSWNNSQFIFLPQSVYNRAYQGIPEEIMMLIDKDQISSQSAKVRYSTYRLVEEILRNKQNTSILY